MRNFGRNFIKSLTPLTNEQIQKVAPSAFAGQAYEKQSDRYAFVPTSAVIDGMRANGFQPYTAFQSLSRVPGKALFTKHRITFRQDGQVALAVGDTVTELVMTNSHDGTSCYVLDLGAFRLACLNGLMVAESLVQAIRIRHTGSIIDAVIEGTTSLVSQAGVMIETIKSWKQITLSNDEQRIFAESALTLRFPEQAPITAGELLNPRRQVDTSNDLYTVFNRVQENAIQGGTRYISGQGDTLRRNRTRAVTGIDQSSTLNKALWSLAEKMAELKTR